MALTLPEIVRLAEREPEALLRRLPAPVRVEAEPFENRHVPGQIDTLRTLVFEGLDIHFYDVADGGGRRLAQAVSVTGEGYRTAGGIGVGSTKAEVHEILGEPLYVEGHDFIYVAPESRDEVAPTQLIIRFEGERVVSLLWSLYVD